MADFPKRAVSCKKLLCILLLVSLAPLFSGELAGSGQSPPSAPPVTLDDIPLGKQATTERAQDDPKQLEILDRDIEKGKYEEARGLLMEYLEVYPNSSKAHYQLGYVLFRIHDINGSIKALAKSLELNIKHAEAHKILGLDLTIIDRYDLAETEFRQAALLKPDSAEIHYFFGRVYYTEGNYPLAKKELEEAIRLNPTYMKAYLNLGLTLEGLGNNSAALEKYLKAIELSEQQKLKSEWAYIDLASFYNRQNKPELAQPYCRKAIEANPKSDQAYFQVAKAYQSQRKWNEAADALRKAIEINPQSASLHYVLSYIYRIMEKAKESREQIEIFEKLRGAQDVRVSPQRRGVGESDLPSLPVSELSSDK
jgi:tetratricopeptide (TPR) repeat protein